MEGSEILNLIGPPMWNPSLINGEPIQQNGRYTVADGRAVIECELWQVTRGMSNPALFPLVRTMQYTLKDDIPRECNVHVQNGVGRAWLQFPKVGHHEVCLGEVHVTIVVTAPVPLQSGYDQTPVV